MVKDTKVREATGVASMFPSEVNKRLPSRKILMVRLQYCLDGAWMVDIPE